MNLPGFKFQVNLYQLNTPFVPGLGTFQVEGGAVPILRDISALEVDSRSVYAAAQSYLQNSNRNYADLPFVQTPLNINTSVTNTQVKNASTTDFIAPDKLFVRDLDALVNPLNWKNNYPANSPYQTTFYNALKNYKTSLASAVVSGILNQGGLTLSKNDITSLLVDLDGFTTQLDELSNTITFSFEANPADSNSGISTSIQENDIIEFLVTRNGESGPTRNFIGFVTTINTTTRYGTVTKITVACHGLSKLLSLTTIVSNRAIQGQFEAGLSDKQSLEINNTQVTPFSDIFNDKNVGQIFTLVMTQFLGLQINTRTTPATFTFDTTQFTDFTSFQVSVYLLYAMYQARGATAIGSLEGGDSLAFNTLLQQGFHLFYSDLQNGSGVFDTLRRVGFYEVFETRDGVITCRPPKYNILNLSDAGFVNSFSGTQVINPQDVVTTTKSHNDVVIRTRVDYQIQLPFTPATQPYVGGHYTDAGTLVQYGMRADAPTSNPNVQNFSVAEIFSALDWTYRTKGARRITLTVQNNRDYQVGTLYYLPDITTNSEESIIISTGSVGYLTSLTTNFKYGQICSHDLTLDFVRQAEIVAVPGRLGATYYVGNYRKLPDLEQLISIVEQNPAAATTPVQTSDPPLAGDALVAKTDSSGTNFVLQSATSNDGGVGYNNNFLTNFSIQAYADFTETTGDGGHSLQNHFLAHLHLADQLLLQGAAAAQFPINTFSINRNFTPLKEGIVKIASRMWASNQTVSASNFGDMNLLKTDSSTRLLTVGEDYTPQLFRTLLGHAPIVSVSVIPESTYSNYKLLRIIITADGAGNSGGSVGGALAKVLFIKVPENLYFSVSNLINTGTLKSAGFRSNATSDALFGSGASTNDPHCLGLGITFEPWGAEQWYSNSAIPGVDSNNVPNVLEFDFIGSNTAGGPLNPTVSSKFFQSVGLRGASVTGILQNALTDALTTSVTGTNVQAALQTLSNLPNGIFAKMFPPNGNFSVVNTCQSAPKFDMRVTCTNMIFLQNYLRAFQDPGTPNPIRLTIPNTTFVLPAVPVFTFGPAGVVSDIVELQMDPVTQIGTSSLSGNVNAQKRTTLMTIQPKAAGPAYGDFFKYLVQHNVPAYGITPAQFISKLAIAP